MKNSTQKELDMLYEQLEEIEEDLARVLKRIHEIETDPEGWEKDREADYQWDLYKDRKREEEEDN
jgi:hypothetical protein